MDQNILEKINPVFNTAKMTVFQLASMGDKDAAEIVGKLNLTFEGTQNSENTKSSPEIMALNTIMLETRYRTSAAIAEQTGYKTIVDLPCGYTPRAKVMSQKGFTYYGLDLPAAIAEAEPLVMSLIDESKRSFVHFYGVDATNGESLKNALKNAGDSLCITTEGLLMYFSDSETGALCNNIRDILEEHGGCWLTPDPEASLQYLLTLQPIAGERFMEILEQSKSRVQEKSDVKVGNNTLIVNPKGDVAANMKKAMMFLAQHGLKAERIAVADYMPELKTLKNLAPAQAETIMQNMQKCAFWKITAINTDSTVDKADLKAESFNMQASEENGTLFLSLKGRVDTLSAPNILTMFEQVSAEHRPGCVVIDCSGLRYISSAGLRALLIMKKKCSNGIKLTAVTPLVREILEQTGFDSVLDVTD